MKNLKFTAIAVAVLAASSFSEMSFAGYRIKNIINTISFIIGYIK